MNSHTKKSIKCLKYNSQLYDNRRSVAYLQQDFWDYGVDIKHGVQIKTQELLPAPDRETWVKKRFQHNTTNTVCLLGILLLLIRQNWCYCCDKYYQQLPLVLNSYYWFYSDKLLVVVAVILHLLYFLLDHRWTLHIYTTYLNRKAVCSTLSFMQYEGSSSLLQLI